MIEDFFMDPVGPYYTGLGAHLGDASVVYVPIDTSKQPLDLNPITFQRERELPIIPILILGGIVIYLLLNR